MQPPSTAEQPPIPSTALPGSLAVATGRIDPLTPEPLDGRILEGLVAKGAVAAETVTEHHNEVAVTGRLSALAERRSLPSGDEVLTWRLVVDRPASGKQSSKQRFDLVDCVAFDGRVRRSAARWQQGEVIEVYGSLRRRFWRGAGGGLQSRCEVEVTNAAKVR